MKRYQVQTETFVERGKGLQTVVISQHNSLNAAKRVARGMGHYPIFEHPLVNRYMPKAVVYDTQAETIAYQPTFRA